MHSVLNIDDEMWDTPMFPYLLHRCSAMLKWFNYSRCKEDKLRDIVSTVGPEAPLHWISGAAELQMYSVIPAVFK